MQVVYLDGIICGKFYADTFIGAWNLWVCAVKWKNQMEFNIVLYLK